MSKRSFEGYTSTMAWRFKASKYKNAAPIVPKPEACVRDIWYVYTILSLRYICIHLNKCTDGVFFIICCHPPYSSNDDDLRFTSSAYIVLDHIKHMEIILQHLPPLWHSIGSMLVLVWLCCQSMIAAAKARICHYYMGTQTRSQI